MTHVGRFWFWVMMAALLAGPAMAQVNPGLPALNITEGPEGGQTYSLSLQIMALMSALTVLPSIILGMTTFTRIIIVLSILRQAMGTQQTPPNQVLVALALFLSLYIMSPTLNLMYEQAVSPYMDGAMPIEDAITIAGGIIKDLWCPIPVKLI
jgi:flagellar biosynthetic protein FliP